MPSRTVIRAISLWQPWATAWALGLKRAETRHWSPRAKGAVYLGPLAIHAAKTERDPRTGASLREWFERRMESCLRSAQAFRAAGFDSWNSLSRGQVIGVCRLGAVRPSEECSPDEIDRAWGNYSVGRSIWFPSDMLAFPEPVSCVGRQGIFNWDVPDYVLALRGIQQVLSAPSDLTLADAPP